MLRIITGKPGMGKTLLLTYLANKEFKKDNPPLKVWFTEKILRKTYIYTLRIYSDFPVLLKKPKKGKIYHVYNEVGDIIQAPYISSLEERIFDLILDNKFIPGAKHFIDEIQIKYDSMEYKDFPDAIAHYCQVHRHLDNDIYICSQSQSRIIKRLVVLAEEYWDIQDFKNRFGFAIVSIRKTWDMMANLENGFFDDNKIDVDYIRRIFRIKKIGSMYDSKYLRYLQKDSKNYQFKMYDSLQLNRTQLLNSFFPSNIEREKLKNVRY